MKKLTMIALASIVMFAMASSAFAVGSGKTVEFQLKSGNVTFDGTTHAKTKCNECHPKLFPMKKGGPPMTMKDMEAGKSCGACHDGTKAFGLKECAKCHKK